MRNVTELDNAYRSHLQAALACERPAWHTIPWQTRAMLVWMKTHTGWVRFSPSLRISPSGA